MKIHETEETQVQQVHQPGGAYHSRTVVQREPYYVTRDDSAWIGVTLSIAVLAAVVALIVWVSYQPPQAAPIPVPTITQTVLGPTRTVPGPTQTQMVPVPGQTTIIEQPSATSSQPSPPESPRESTPNPDDSTSK